MRFQDILPHLAAGRKVRQRQGDAVYVLRNGVLGIALNYTPPNDWKPSKSADLLATDWELVEDVTPACAACGDREATITRLTRELQETRANYIQQRRRCCACCACFMCRK